MIRFSVLLLAIAASVSGQTFSGHPSDKPKITSRFLTDQQNWTKIDEGFPRLKTATDDDESGGENRRFFYALGHYSVPEGKHRFSPETKQKLLNDYEQNGFKTIKLQFKFWYNRLSNPCTRSFFIYPSMKPLPENEPNSWTVIEREFSIKDRTELEQLNEEFFIYLDIANHCEESIWAFQQISLSYNQTKFDCGTANADGSLVCFLDPILKSMKYLPKYFPVDSSTPSTVTHFTAINGSHLTIDQIRLDGSLDGWDLCWRWRYFVAATNARMAIRLGYNDTAAALTLLELGGLEPLDSAPHRPLLFDQPTQETCLRSLIGEQLLHGLQTVSFVPTNLAKNDDLVLVQIFNEVEGPLYVRPIGSRVTAVPLAFIARTATELSLADETGFDWSTYTLGTQWPVHLPRQLDQPDEMDNTTDTVIEMMATGSDTRRSVIVESQWLRRTIHSADRLLFTVESFQDNSLALEHITVRLLNEQRQELDILANNFQPVHKTETFKTELKLANKNVDNQTVYKLTFTMTFRDPAGVDKKSRLFRLINVSFGDPCIDANGYPQQCFNIETEKNDPEIVCRRQIEEFRNNIDYQCQCQFELGAKGPNCLEKDYCKYRHLSMRETATTISGVDATNKMNGEEFCQSTIAKCQTGGGFENYKFICTCKDDTLWFNYGVRQCQQVDECLLHPPDDFEAKVCQQQINGNNGHRECKCKCDEKNGYFATDESGQKCQQDETKCYRCPNSMMLDACTKYGSVEFCKCPPGFRYDRNEKRCRSAICEFPAMNQCTQQCENVDDKEPNYRCKCDTRYYDEVTSKNDAGNETYTKCQLKKNAPEQCRQCTGPFQVCRDDRCQCLDDFEPDTTVADGQLHCRITSKVKRNGCPNPDNLRIRQENRLECDCSEESLAHWWKPIESTTGGHDCQLIRTACDPGEIGDETCAKHDSLCVIDREKPEHFHCQCPYGHTFADRTMAKSGPELKPQHRCREVCQLPYHEQRCAAIGARCNPIKLWKELHHSVTPNTDHYCDCIPGLFLSGSVCEQRKNVHTLKMSLAWSIGLQGVLVKTRETLRNLLPYRFDYQDDTFDSRLDFLDPLGYGQAQKRSWSKNQPKLAPHAARWDQWIRAETFRERVRIIMKNYQIVKYGEQVELLLPEPDPRQPNRYVATVYLHLPNVDGPSVIRKYFKCYGQDECAVPYMNVTIEPDSLTAKPFQPCQHRDVCRGMSDCLDPDNDGDGAYFACRCNRTYFDIEERYAFRTGRPEVVTPNERCLARPMCDRYQQDHQDCIERDPIYDPDTARWIKPEPVLLCQHGYRRVARTGRCETVCPIGICADGGRCVVEGRNGSRCVCDDNHYGDRCQHELKSETPWIVAVVILSLLAVTGIAGVAFLYLRSSYHRQKHHHQQHEQQQTSTSSPSAVDQMEPETELFSHQQQLQQETSPKQQKQQIQSLAKMAKLFPIRKGRYEINHPLSS